MKKFNQVISIEVAVDTIADLLLANMNPDFKHKEIVAEAIVGRMMNDSSLSFLYNSLNGYPCTIDFKVDDEIKAVKPMRIYGFWTPESIANNDSCYGDVLDAKIIEINVYSNQKLNIEYLVPDKKGVMQKQTKWVNHTEWNKIA